MKKISTNQNDCSFENKNKFEDLLNRIKILGGSIAKNSKQTCILGVMMGCILFSGYNVSKILTDFLQLIEFTYEISQEDESVSSKNDDFLKKVYNDYILAGNFSSSITPKYYFKDNNLYDNEGNIILLDEVKKPVHFIKCNLYDETFQNIHLSSSKIKTLYLDYSSVDDNFINYLPSTIEELSLDYCNYITNLNGLPKRCPNIIRMSINASASLSDLNFIYDLPNLKEIYISDSPYITKELLDYLKSNNITTNITEQDIINSQKVDEIINKIIKPKMTDKEKIQAVCLYVLNNVEYDFRQTIESNATPLTCVLKDGKGVCASYAYFTNVLLNKAGIKSFEVTNSDHGWNIIKLDNNYYYIDTTNMDDSAFYNFLLKILNISKYYMYDTDNTYRSAMSKPTDDITMIPMSLIEDIQMGVDNKDIFEKYVGKIGNFGVVLGSILTGVITALGPCIFDKFTKDIPKLYYSIKEDYEDSLYAQTEMTDTDDYETFVPLASIEKERQSKYSSLEELNQLYELRDSLLQQNEDLSNQLKK